MIPPRGTRYPYQKILLRYTNYILCDIKHMSKASMEFIWAHTELKLHTVHCVQVCICVYVSVWNVNLRK